MKLLSLIFVSLIMGLIAQNPGIQVNVRQQVIDGLKDTLVDFILSHTEAIPLPNIVLKGLTLHDLRVSCPGISSDNVQVNLEDGYVHLAINDFELSLSGYSKVNWWVLNFNHTFRLYTTGNVLSVDVTPVIGRYVHFNISNATVHIGQVHFDVNGSFSQLESQLVSSAVQEIVNVLNQQLKKVLEKQLPEALNDQPSNTPAPAEVQQGSGKEINTTLGFNYTFVNPPAIRPGYLFAGLNGTIYVRNNSNAKIPYTNNVVMPEVDTASANGVQFFLSQYVLQTGLYALQVEGKLQLNVTSDDLPANSPIQMDTTSLNFVFPGLSKKYGSNQPCYLFCWADNSSYPKASFYEGGAGVTITSLCSLFAQSASTKQWSLAITFKTNFAVQGGIVVNTTSNKLFFNITNLAVSSTSIVTSNIGYQSGSLLQLELNIVLTGFKSVFNAMLSKDGIPIPQIPHSELSNATLAFHNGYAEGTVNVEFTAKHQKNVFFAKVDSAGTLGWAENSSDNEDSFDWNN